MLDLIDEPNLLDRLSELDEGLLDADTRPYVPPPPLIDRLLIPEADGRWRMNCRQTPSEPDAVDARTAFDTLDAGLLESSATADSVFSRHADIVRQGRRQHVVYPNARHHFDGAELRKLTIVADARGGRGATMDYDPAAHEDAEKQVRAFLAAHLGK